MKKYILDVKRLSSITGETQKEIAENLGVSTASLSEAKNTPTKKWGMIKNYIENYQKNVDILSIIKEVK